MTDHFGLTTSPLKATQKAAGHRKEMTALQVREEYTQPYKHFCRVHLNAPLDPKDLESLDADKPLQTLVDSYLKGPGGGKSQYSILCKILNHLSNKFRGANEEVVFVDHHTENLKHHPNGHFDCSPDIPAVLMSRFLTYPPSTGPCKCAEWSDLESVAEVKNKHEYMNGPGQLAAYLGLANQARPDKVGSYGVALSPNGYQIQYSDSGGLTTSPLFDWKSLAPLASYVYTLYFPLNGRPRCDPTITRSPSRTTTGMPTWDVTFQGTSYAACEVTLVGRPWKRMTWVAQTAGEYPIVIKDSYWAYGRTFKEGKLYDLLQNSKPAPGFVRVIAHGDILYDGEPVTSINIEPHVHRVKTRIITGTSGDPLIKTPSVQHFLMAMYDVLEAHRWAVKERNIIHRDISQVNIIVNPKDSSNNRLNESARPRFINEILTREEHALPVARLYDFDDAAENNRKLAKTSTFKKPLERSPDYEHLRHRTGTPRFMARAVAAGRNLGRSWNVFKHMPSFKSNNLVLYKNVHLAAGVDPLRHFEDHDGTTHGVHFDSKESDEDESDSDESDDGESGVGESDDDKSNDAGSEGQAQIFEHLPRHDAESVFWVIAVFLLRALPRGQRPEKDKHMVFLAEAWKWIESHEIKPNPGDFPSVDSRIGLLSCPEIWKQNLHKKLVPLAPMMKELIAQVRPEYGHLPTPPDDFHLHEAMQRILFKYVVRFAGASDIPLDTEQSRIILIPKEATEHRASTEISLDGQHLQRAGHRSRFSVSRGSSSIRKDKRKRSDSAASSPSDGSLPRPMPRMRLPEFPFEGLEDNHCRH